MARVRRSVPQCGVWDAWEMLAVQWRAREASFKSAHALLSLDNFLTPFSYLISNANSTPRVSYSFSLRLFVKPFSDAPDVAHHYGENRWRKCCFLDVCGQQLCNIQRNIQRNIWRVQILICDMPSVQCNTQTLATPMPSERRCLYTKRLCYLEAVVNPTVLSTVA
jgi:hypothetical protein